MNYFQHSGVGYGRSRGYAPVGMMPPATAYPGSGGYSASGMAASPSMAEVTQFITDGLIRPITDGIRQAAVNIADSIGSMSGPSIMGGMARPGAMSGRIGPRPQPWSWQGAWQAPGCKCGGRGCEECCPTCEHCDPCHCRCCISDADLVIYSRLAERRIVPLRIENRWRRERDIKIELSTWTTRGGKAAEVHAVLESPAPSFKLGPCEVRTITLVVEAMAGERQEGQQLPDVDDCTVYYADLRVEGCDIRPIRIALALLPRDCHAYDIQCRCGCC